MIYHRFVYVFCVEAKDSLVKRGYVMLHDDARQKVWVFANKEGVPFPDEDYPFILSDTLSI